MASPSSTSVPSSADLLSASASSANQSSSPPRKRVRLLSQYDKQSTSTESDTSSNPTAADEFHNYLACCENGTRLSGLQFWFQNSTFPRIKVLATKFLAVPATSSPVERVFSTGGIFMRPHRARLSNQSLGDLMMLKCNLVKLTKSFVYVEKLLKLRAV